MNERKWHRAAEVFPDNTPSGMPDFPTEPEAIYARIARIEPGPYAKTRNFLWGSITYLSPYISRGVISTRQVYEALRARGFGFYQMEKLVSELAWRDFFQRVWQHHGDNILTDLRQPQQDVHHHRLPKALDAASTGIDVLDRQIEQLYTTGYLHNHVRMYLAALACNVGKAHWLQPAQWMYYHLLDGDPASNHLSWQWVAGSFSSKKYWCNQENINKYTGSRQQKSYLNMGYESLTEQPVPEALSDTKPFIGTTPLPPPVTLQAGSPGDLLLYNHFNLDPYWHAGETAHRILLLEPDHFARFPISGKVLDFVLALAKNIPGIQVFTGSVAQLMAGLHEAGWIDDESRIWYKEHPTTRHYPGICEPRDWLVPEVSGPFNSFFAYWKQAERYLRKN